MDLDEHGLIGTQLDEEALTLVTSQSRHADNSSNAPSQGSQQALFNNSWGILRQHSSEGIVEVMLQYRVKDGRKDTCYVLGRSRNSDIPIPDRRVSSTHCAIYCDYTEPRMRVFLEDCSANGTYVNDALTKLSRGQRMELRSGDEIYLVNPRTLEPGEMHFHPSVFTFINMRDRILATREIAAAPTTSKTTRKFTLNNNVPANESSANDPTNTSNVPQATTELTPQIEDLYMIGDQIGSGMSGQVYLCIQRSTGRRCAVKIIDTRKFSMTPGLAKDELLQEAALMQELKHDYVIEVIDTFHSPTAIYIVMELLEGGDLFDRIVERIRYTEDNARKVMFQILTAVHYLHSKRIVHRDLKPENILLVSAKDDTKIKVTDFGLAKKVSAEGLRTFCGTPQYFAPEVLLRRNGSLKKGAGHYGMAADMWSIGVIMYIMLSGTFPFDEENLYDQIEQAKYSVTGNEWNPISWEAKHMIRSLLTLRADQRLTTQEALQHPWILNTKLTASYVNRLLPAAVANNNNRTGIDQNDNIDDKDDVTKKPATNARKSQSVQRKPSARGKKASQQQATATTAQDEPATSSALEKQTSLLKRSSLSRLSFVVKSSTTTQSTTTPGFAAPATNSTSLLHTVLQQANNHTNNNVSSNSNGSAMNVIAQSSNCPVEAEENAMPSLLDIYNVDAGGYMTPDEEEIRATKSLVRTLFSSPMTNVKTNANDSIDKPMSPVHNVAVNTDVNSDATNLKPISPVAISRSNSGNGQKRTPRMTMVNNNSNPTVTASIAHNPSNDKKSVGSDVQVVEGEFKVVKNLTGGDLLKYSHLDMTTDEIGAFTSDEEDNGDNNKATEVRPSANVAKGKSSRTRRLLSLPKTSDQPMKRHLSKRPSLLSSGDNGCENVDINNVSSGSIAVTKSPSAAPHKSILKNATSASSSASVVSCHPPLSNHTSPITADVASLASSSTPTASAVMSAVTRTTPSPQATTTTRKRKVNFASSSAAATAEDTATPVVTTDNTSAHLPAPSSSTTATLVSSTHGHKRQRSLRDLWASSSSSSSLAPPLTTASVIVIDDDISRSKSPLETHHTPAAVNNVSSSSDNVDIGSPVSTSVAISHMKPANLFFSPVGVKKTKRSSPNSTKLNRKRTHSQSVDAMMDTSTSVAPVSSTSTTTTTTTRRKLRTPVQSLSALFATHQIMPADAT